MKSSFELAMERLGGSTKKLSDDQKIKIAEIDSKYKAKIAGIKLRSQEDLAKTANPEEDDKIRKEVSDEIQRSEVNVKRKKTRSEQNSMHGDLPNIEFLKRYTSKSNNGIFINLDLLANKM